MLTYFMRKKNPFVQMNFSILSGVYLSFNQIHFHDFGCGIFII
jgi:hypothetical protein